MWTDEMEVWHWIVIGIVLAALIACAIWCGYSYMTGKSMANKSARDLVASASRRKGAGGLYGGGSAYEESAEEYFGGGVRVPRAYVTSPDFKNIQKMVCPKSPEFMLFRSNKKNPFVKISVGDEFEIFESTPQAERDASDTTEQQSFTASVTAFTTGPISKLLTKDTFAKGGFTSLAHAKEQFKKFNGEYLDDDESMQAITFSKN